eukprot:241440_1
MSSNALATLAILIIALVDGQNDIVAIGGYSEKEGLLFASLNEADGSLTTVNGPFNVGPNPSAITLIQHNNYNMIYTVNEAGERSKLVTVPFDPLNNYSINTDGIVSQSSYGETPCFLTHDINMKFLYIANYGGSGHNASFAVFEIDAETGYLSTDPIVYKKFASGSHVHCIQPNPNDFYNFYIADLGRNVVEHYRIVDTNNEYSLQLVSWIDFQPNSGPRTLAFNPIIDGILYLSLETSSKVSVITFDVNNYKLLDIQQTLSTLPINNTEYSACSHVQADNTGKYLYVGNRFTDNIASFKINVNNGLLIGNSLYLNECGGEIPRMFNIDKTNNYMLICNQEGDAPNVGTYKIDHQDNGHLKYLSQFDAARPAWAYITNT